MLASIADAARFSLGDSFFRDTKPVYHALETSKVVLGAAYNFPDPNDPAQAAEIGTFEAQVSVLVLRAPLICFAVNE